MEKHNDTEVTTRLKYTSENIVAIISFVVLNIKEKELSNTHGRDRGCIWDLTGNNGPI